MRGGKGGAGGEGGYRAPIGPRDGSIGYEGHTYGGGGGEEGGHMGYGGSIWLL